MPDFHLHPATDGDAPFLFDAYEATLRGHVEATWGWDEAFQRQGFKTHHPLHEWRVIHVAGSRAGGLHVQDTTASRFVRMLFLLPGFQGQGLGERLLAQESQQARRDGKPLELKVLKVNLRARALYERLGFALVAEDAAALHLRAPGNE